MKVEYECIMEMNGKFPMVGVIIINVFAKDLHPRAYVFSLCNEKVRASVVRGTTRTKGEVIVMKSITCTNRMVTWEPTKEIEL